MSGPSNTYQTPNLAASGASFAQFQSGGFTKVLELAITANNTATAAPTSAPTAAATGGGASGGTLPAGTYLLKFTEVNGIGETTASPESTTLTVAATNIPRVTFPSLKTGNTARNLYVTPTNGATGTEVLFAAGITTTTYDMTAPAPTSTTTPPTTNTTALSGDQISRIRSGENNSLQNVYNQMVQGLSNFNQGDPVDIALFVQHLSIFTVTFKILLATLEACATLVGANPGTLGVSQTAIGHQKGKRTWP